MHGEVLRVHLNKSGQSTSTNGPASELQHMHS